MSDFVDIAYSMKFSGADKIIITCTDYTKEEKSSKKREINDVSIINQITSLLEALPKTGNVMLSLVPSVIYEVTALKDNKPLGFFEFYGDNLKTEDTSFYKGDEEISKNESILFNLIDF